MTGKFVKPDITKPSMAVNRKNRMGGEKQVAVIGIVGFFDRLFRMEEQTCKCRGIYD